ncbi:hypothetical protein E2C01_101093 [Portunus trituberculatus]|uniref:Uncharacterized protein n=1 Tax=Portunus trituberculatus TaxID=210409 RepID=A0A5B7KEZ5_PORTR|nr:hypothetical protein [Portunus trituberculatus]
MTITNHHHHHHHHYHHHHNHHHLLEATFVRPPVNLHKPLISSFLNPHFAPLAPEIFPRLHLPLSTRGQRAKHNHRNPMILKGSDW